MLNPPVCRLCRHAHWSRQPHVWPDKKTAFMFESEPRWPIEDKLGLPGREPPPVPLQRVKTKRGRARKRRTLVLSEEQRKAIGARLAAARAAKRVSKEPTGEGLA